MKKTVIKVGFCVAYDWNLLKTSVPKVYNAADTICLSIDKNRKSWAGKSYEFDNSAFFGWIRSIDADHKIQVYEDDFAIPGLSTIENDTRQRNLMADFLGEDGWHIQVDSDEYLLDFEGFVKYLLKINPEPQFSDKPVNVCVNVIPLIKQIACEGYVFVKFENKFIENQPMATNRPVYESAKRNGHFNIISPYFLVHETWARSEEDLWKKINNWGHSNDFNLKSYFKLWQAIDRYNYIFIKNFHPTHAEAWPALEFCEGKDIDQLLKNISSKIKFKYSSTTLFIKNSRNIARIKALFNKVLYLKIN